MLFKKSSTGQDLTILRKDKPVGQDFAQSFSWAKSIDALADVYNGVSDGRLVYENTY